MLGLVDFFRAVRNTVRLALRRVHPLAGPVLIGVIWVVALGSVLWITREQDDGSSTDDAASYTEREVAGTRDAGRDGGDGGGGSDGVGQVEWTDGTDGSSGDGDADGAGDDGSGGEADGADDEGSSGEDDPTLESPGGPGRVTPPSSTGTPPSWDPQEPEEPGPGEPGPTTTPTTTPATSGPTTSTTVPAGGGLLDVLLGVLFP